jgi:hypothetical protein
VDQEQQPVIRQLERPIMASDWYIKINNAEHGPLTSDRLKQLAQQGKVTPDTSVKKGQAGTWHRANDVHGLFAAPGSQSTPATATPQGSPVETQWYLFTGEKQFGPVPLATLRQWATDGRVTATMHVRQAEGGNWMPAGQLPGVFPASEASQPSPGPGPATSAAPDPHAFLEPAGSDAPQSSATKPCPFCGETILVVAQKCKHCGEFLDHGSKTRGGARATESDKRILSLFLLWWFFGLFGGHAFYAGRRWQGFFFLFALFVAYYSWVQGIAAGDGYKAFAVLVVFCVGVALLSDLIHILSGTYKDGSGHRITKWT